MRVPSVLLEVPVRYAAEVPRDEAQLTRYLATLQGGHEQRAVKLPNPMYFIA